MLIQPLLILTLAATFFMSGANGQALEGSITLSFALAVGKALVTAPKPFIEVSSTERVYISGGHALALADTQCLYTETPQVQLCLGNRWPTRVRLVPQGHLKIGLHSPGLSQLAYRYNPSFVLEPLFSPLFPDSDAIPDRNPVARAIITTILQGIKRQNDIIEQARQWSLLLSHLNNNKSDSTLFEKPPGESGAPEDSTPEESAEEDSEPIEWWGVAQQPAPHTNDSDLVRVRFNHDILLKPDTRYCFAPGNETRACRQAAPGDDSGSEGNGSSDESSDKDPDKEDIEIDTEPEVEFIGTTPDPFPVSREIREYCANLEQKKIKQEPTSDSELPIGSEVEIAEADPTLKRLADHLPPATSKKSTHSGNKPHQCKECGKSFAQHGHLKVHQRTHSGEKPYSCQVCGRAFTQDSTLKRHQRTHSGEKPFSCQVCDKAFARASTLTIHQRTHSGEKPYPCRVCNKAFSDRSTLKTHQRTHSGEKPYPCRVCNKAFSDRSTLKTHQRTHSGERPYPCQVCGKAFSQSGHLKTHLSTHRTAGKPPNQRQ